MQLARQTFLLFVLNILDAVLTIYWVRNGYATEGNHLMASLLDMGDMPFLIVKIVVGATAAIVFSYWGHMRLAKFGLTVVLAIYLGLMTIHFFTGLTAFGIVSAATVNEIKIFTNSIFALVL